MGEEVERKNTKGKGVNDVGVKTFSEFRKPKNLNFFFIHSFSCAGSSRRNIGRKVASDDDRRLAPSRCSRTDCRYGAALHHQRRLRRPCLRSYGQSTLSTPNPTAAASSQVSFARLSIITQSSRLLGQNCRFEREKSLKS
jgi:hypothetical protein